ncbi:MAG TPA: glycosyltransferase [Sphingomicrobium sp.]|nr:glycosyltransferase [Sphingomicrobium sp.]
MKLTEEIGASRLAVVIPAYNAAATLSECVSALLRSERRPDEIILFDDGSTDDTVEIARAAGLRVVANGKSKQGPAVGRNVGAAATSAAIIAFVDADVAVWPEALGRLEAPIIAGEAVASFGCYDDRPRSRRVAALYANLRHHWVHRHGKSEAFTFWSGLGAIRRDVFSAQRGFDPRFAEPSIEDVELGIRIVESGGRIRLVTDALGTHCKDWGLVQLWRTDVLRRAIPWAQLMKDGRGRSDDLNVSRREQFAAVLAHCVWASGLAALVRPSLWPLPVAAIGGYVALNRQFFAFLFRSGGPRAGLAGIGLHWCYHLYASLAYVWVASGLSSIFDRLRPAEKSKWQDSAGPRPRVPDSDPSHPTRSRTPRR